MTLLAQLWQNLAAPFSPDSLGWLPQGISGNRCRVVAYIDARDVMDRLDAVVGPAAWWDDYSPLDGGSVLCRLTLDTGDGRPPISKQDVGAPSDQKDAGDRLKAAFSDALKRAAVKFGVGRYLYRLPAFWSDYDPAKKQPVGTPRLPLWALPREPTAKEIEAAGGQIQADGDGDMPLAAYPASLAIVTTRVAACGLTLETVAQKLGYAAPGEIRAKDFGEIMARLDKVQAAAKKEKVKK